MINPTADHVGYPVLYRAKGGDTREIGIIEAVTPASVFVRYAGDEQPKATDRADLAFLAKRPGEASGPGGKMENQARHIARALLGETTLDPTLIERSWFRFVCLIDE